MNPTEILRKVGERYSQCLSYSDSGEVEFDDVHQNKEHIEFKSAFVRPDYLQFQWQDYGPRRGKSQQFSTLWSGGGKTVTLWDTSKVVLEEEENLRLAIAGATGCSAGAASIVPPLLLSELSTDCINLLQVRDVELLGEETFNELECYVLKGSLLKQDDHVLWISARDFSIRRVRNDVSTTAEESRRNHEELIANVELMARLSEHGIAPPKNIEYTDHRFVTEYIYSAVFFDTQIVRALQPVES